MIRMPAIAAAAMAGLLQAGAPGPAERRPGRTEPSPGTSAWVPVAVVRHVAADRHRSFSDRRRELVDSIRARVRKADPAVDDAHLERVLSVMGAIPRERFVAREAMPLAYLPTPLNIGYGQTISDAYIVAIMTAELRLPPNADVLDVGTGSGYQAAVLSRLARRVSSIEIVKPLADAAAGRLRRLGYRNVEVRAGDGFAGWPEHAPFDGIVVAAGAAKVPQPLIDQLKPGGRLVMPIGPIAAQEQVLVVAKGPHGAILRCSLGQRTFVPLTGAGQRSPEGLRALHWAMPKCHAAELS